MRHLTSDELRRDLAVRDLSDPVGGVHAVNLMLDEVVRALDHPRAIVHRGQRVVSVEDNYDLLGYPPGGAARSARYSRYVDERHLLRTQASALVPGALRAAEPGVEHLLVCPALVYRRDQIDAQHTGTPHQVDLWQLTSAPPCVNDLTDMVARVLASALPGAQWRTVPAAHPYTQGGLEIQAWSGTAWVEVGECGLARTEVLERCGHQGYALAVGLGLDRLVMLRKGVPDIRLLRSKDSRVVAQMGDLALYRSVSRQPAAVRDISVALDRALDVELLGDALRDALGDHAELVEEALVLSSTPVAELSEVARIRLGARPDQTNLLVRLVLRAPERSLSKAEANLLKDRVYAHLHQGA